ncbi:MAG: 50S ribosomal protein L23 [Dehalococcoidia bacterium]
MHVLQVLKRPLITEKSTLLQERNKFVFEVEPAANKSQVKDAVERAFEVKVLDVNILPIRGERRRLRNGRWLAAKSGKKAVVTLAQGDTIQLFEGA